MSAALRLSGLMDPDPETAINFWTRLHVIKACLQQLNSYRQMESKPKGEEIPDGIFNSLTKKILDHHKVYVSKKDVQDWDENFEVNAGVLKKLCPKPVICVTITELAQKVVKQIDMVKFGPEQIHPILKRSLYPVPEETVRGIYAWWTSACRGLSVRDSVLCSNAKLAKDVSAVLRKLIRQRDTRTDEDVSEAKHDVDSSASKEVLEEEEVSSTIFSTPSSNGESQQREDVSQSSPHELPYDSQYGDSSSFPPMEYNRYSTSGPSYYYSTAYHDTPSSTMILGRSFQPPTVSSSTHFYSSPSRSSTSPKQSHSYSAAKSSPWHGTDFSPDQQLTPESSSHFSSMPIPRSRTMQKLLGIDDKASSSSHFIVVDDEPALPTPSSSSFSSSTTNPSSSSSSSAFTTTVPTSTFKVTPGRSYSMTTAGASLPTSMRLPTTPSRPPGKLSESSSGAPSTPLRQLMVNIAGIDLQSTSGSKLRHMARSDVISFAARKMHATADLLKAVYRGDKGAARAFTKAITSTAKILNYAKSADPAKPSLSARRGKTKERQRDSNTGKLKEKRREKKSKERTDKEKLRERIKERLERQKEKGKERGRDKHRDKDGSKSRRKRRRSKDKKDKDKKEKHQTKRKKPSKHADVANQSTDKNARNQTHAIAQSSTNMQVTQAPQRPHGQQETIGQFLQHQPKQPRSHTPHQLPNHGNNEGNAEKVTDKKVKQKRVLENNRRLSDEAPPGEDVKSSSPETPRHNKKRRKVEVDSKDNNKVEVDEFAFITSN